MAYEAENLRSARLFHATSEMEAEAIRRYGLKQPIAVVPNGVTIPEAHASLRGGFEVRFSELKGRRFLLYMGRLDPKKGLDLLLEAWAILQADFSSWHLVIAGPDLTGYSTALKATISNNRALLNSITFAGMVEGTLKSSLLTHADLFVLPTRSENFGIAVAEALAHGVPVVTTTAAPWADLVSRACGWWVAPESAFITNALRSAMQLPPSDLKAMGERGRRYVAEQFSWDFVGQRMTEVYRWIVAGGPLPASVHKS